MNITIYVLLFMFRTFLMVNSYTNVMVDNGLIQISNDKIRCDGVLCPDGSFACSVESITTKDLKQIETAKKCLSNDGAVIRKEVRRRTNPNPKEKIYSVASADLDGNVQQMDNGGNSFKTPTQAEINGFVNSQIEDSRKLTENILANVQNTLRNIGIG